MFPIMLLMSVVLVNEFPDCLIRDCPVVHRFESCDCGSDGFVWRMKKKKASRENGKTESGR